MNIISSTHKKVLMQIVRITKMPADRVLFESLVEFYKKKTGKDFKI